MFGCDKQFFSLIYYVRIHPDKYGRPFSLFIIFFGRDNRKMSQTFSLSELRNSSKSKLKVFLPVIESPFTFFGKSREIYLCNDD